jgi:hypothetical protein
VTARVEMVISAITVGDRIRNGYGDLTGLMASISEIGLLQPIGVTDRGALVFGGRRLEALRRLGYTTAAVRVLSASADSVTEMRAELDENIERTPLSAVEATELRKRIRDHNSTARAALAPEPPGDDGTAFDEPHPYEEADQPAMAASPEISASGNQRAEERMDTEDNFATEAPDHPAEPPPLTPVAELERQVQAATGYSTTTLKRVERIQELTASSSATVAAAAARALELIDEGAPVKPQLDKVVELQSAAAATAKYPALKLLGSDPKHVLRMESFLDEILATSGPEAVEEEISTLEGMWGAPEAITAASVSVEERERAYEFNSSLADVVNKWGRSSASQTVSHVIPSLPDVAIRSWAALAKDLRAIADDITESIPDKRTNVGTR